MNEARAAHVDADVLVGTLRGRANVDQVLGAIIEGLARESASLAWEIRQGRQAGRDTSQLSSRRIDGLQKIAMIELGRRKLGLEGELGPQNPRMNTVVTCFMTTVSDVLEGALPVARASHLCGMIERRFREWQEGAVTSDGS